MKKLFILAAAIVAFASCQKEPETIVNDGSIKFANLETRTTVTNVNSLDDGFTVLGYAGGVEIFDNEATTKSGSYWTTETKKFWANNTNYNFFAIYPKQKLTIGANQASASCVITNNGETDVVLAGRNVVTDGNGTQRGAAQLVFKHALSRVKFNFTNGYTSADTDVKVDITGLQLVNVAKTGTVAVTSTDNVENALASTSVISWSNVEAPGTLDIDYMVNNEPAFANTEITEGTTVGTDYKYIIPQENQAYNLVGTIRVYDQTATIRTWTFDETNPLAVTVVKADASKVTALTHEAGLSYTYNMTISSTLKEITFTVAVEPWKEGNNGGENIEFPNN